MPASTRSRPSRREILRNVSGSSVSRLMFSRCRPASRSACACSASRMPLVVSAMSSMPGDRRPASRRAGARSCRTSGSPPVSRSLLHAQLRHDADEALDLLERQNLAPRLEAHVLGRHAVEAADVAAIGDADPQIGVHAAEAVDQRRGIGKRRWIRLEGHLRSRPASVRCRTSSHPRQGIETVRADPCMQSPRDAINRVLRFGLTPGWTHSLVPSAQFSFFQIGTTSLSVSISHLAGLEGRLAMRRADGHGHAGLASSRWPKRWTIAHSTSGQRRRASASSSASLLAAISG